MQNGGYKVCYAKYAFYLSPLFEKYALVVPCMCVCCLFLSGGSCVLTWPWCAVQGVRE